MPCCIGARTWLVSTAVVMPVMAVGTLEPVRALADGKVPVLRWIDDTVSDAIRNKKVVGGNHSEQS